MSEQDDEREPIEAALIYLDGVRFGLLAQWRVFYTDPAIEGTEFFDVTARSVWLGPGGTLVFKAGDRQLFVTAYAPHNWDQVERVEGSTVHAKNTLAG